MSILWLLDADNPAVESKGEFLVIVFLQGWGGGLHVASREKGRLGELPARSPLDMFSLVVSIFICREAFDSVSKVIFILLSC